MRLTDSYFIAKLSTIMATKKPLRVIRCTTHHHACECREWQYKRMEIALKVIQTWAGCYNEDIESAQKAMSDIYKKCKETLGYNDA